MSADIVNLMMSAATLAVVAAASIAAIVQLRHLRTSNQLNALLEIMNQWNLSTVQEALKELHAMPEKMQDPEYRKALLAPGMVDRANHPEFLAMDLWEQIGTFGKHGLIDEAILLDITSSQIVSAWESAEPAIALMRSHRGPSAFENFEYLAVRAKQFNSRYPNGAYPQGVPRMKDL